MLRTSVARAALFAAVVGSSLLAAHPSAAQDADPQPRDQVVLAGDVFVRRGDEVGQVVVLNGTVTVAGVARGDVVVLHGEITVTGQVSGSVVSVDGPVRLGPNAQVLGDVIAREPVTRASGATVAGSVREGTAFVYRRPADIFGPFTTWLAVALSTLVLAALLLLLAPRASESVAATARSAPWRSVGIGVALVALVPVLGVALVVSLLGFPLGLSLLLASWFVASVGFAWSVFAIGRLLWRVPRSRWLALPSGWAVVTAAAAVPYVGGVVWGAGAVLGTGAATVAAWRARRAPSEGDRRSGGRHRPGAKMDRTREPEPLVTERALGAEGAGL
jgi:hypothetical protein